MECEEDYGTKTSWLRFPILPLAGCIFMKYLFHCSWLVFTSVKWEEKIIFSSGIVVTLDLGPYTVKQLLYFFSVLSYFLLNLLLKCVQLHPQIHIALSEGLLSGLRVT